MEPGVWRDESVLKDPSFINQETWDSFSSPTFPSCCIFNYRIKQRKVAPTVLLNLIFKHAHLVAVT